MSAPDLRLSLCNSSWPGKSGARPQRIDPAIHVLATKKGVDARHKAGHYGEEQS
jgi:hypothetical protein